MDYIIVTNRGYWGKGKTMSEAAKNASISSRPCQAFVYRLDPALIENSGVTDMGGIHWDWTELALSLTDEVRRVIQRNVKLGLFDAKLTKGQLSLTVVE